MTILIGVDPGSRYTGYGVIRVVGNKTEHLDHGVLMVGSGAFDQRLKDIFCGLSQVMEQWQPVEMAVEQVFLARNAASALKLGQARGAAIVAGAQRGLGVAEYSARQVKQAVVGTGKADKTQVQQMIKVLLRLPEVPQEDAADALAVALCHAHSRQGLMNLAGVASVRRGRLR